MERINRLEDSHGQAALVDLGILPELLASSRLLKKPAT
jgi:hypothetical protein